MLWQRLSSGQADSKIAALKRKYSDREASRRPTARCHPEPRSRSSRTSVRDLLFILPAAPSLRHLPVLGAPCAVVARGMQCTTGRAARTRTRIPPRFRRSTKFGGALGLLQRRRPPRCHPEVAVATEGSAFRFCSVSNLKFQICDLPTLLSHAVPFRTEGTLLPQAVAAAAKVYLLDANVHQQDDLRGAHKVELSPPKQRRTTRPRQRHGRFVVILSEASRSGFSGNRPISAARRSRTIPLRFSAAFSAPRCL